MIKIASAIFVYVVTAPAFLLCAETNTVAKVAKTMTVVRCQYVIEDGRQCVYQAESGKQFCWRHQGAVKAVGEAWQGAEKIADKAWTSTIQWSTNVWNSTKGVADDARIGLVEMLGGKDAKKKERAAK